MKLPFLAGAVGVALAGARLVPFLLSPLCVALRYRCFQVHSQHVPGMCLSTLSSQMWLGCEKKYKLIKKVCNEIKLESF